MIRAITKLGLKEMPLRKNARSAVHSFFDPHTGKLYTTFTSGLIQHERPGTEQNLHGHLNKIEQTLNKKDNTVIRNVVKLNTETSRLERLAEYLTNTAERKRKPMAASERKLLIEKGYSVAS